MARKSFITLRAGPLSGEADVQRNVCHVVKVNLARQEITEYMPYAMTECQVVRMAAQQSVYRVPN